MKKIKMIFGVATIIVGIAVIMPTTIGTITNIKQTVAKDINIDEKPDLEVEEITWRHPDILGPGIIFCGTIKNVGSIDASPTNEDSWITVQITCRRVIIPTFRDKQITSIGPPDNTIQPGDTRIVETCTIYPPTFTIIPNIVFVCVKADPNNVIDESNEHNNVKYGFFRVGWFEADQIIISRI